ncbi:MAG: ABC transporter ATP-binding protein [Actinomycetes bacterium]
MNPAVRFDSVSVRYALDAPPVLRDVSLDVDEGTLCLVVGPTGGGKSTLLRCVSGLVPRFSGGHLAGTVTFGGRSTEDFPPRELADVVGTVSQDPLAGFVTDTVTDEIVFVMENLGMPVDVIRRRLEDTLDVMGLNEVRERPLRDLSGGQQQRVAIAAVLAAGPRVLVLDEPTSALDPAAADEVLASLTRLVHDVGLTVLMAEHRLERVVQFADMVVHVPGGGAPVRSGAPRDVLVHPAPRPPVMLLGECAGWEPVPLTVREARRSAPPLRSQLDELVGPATVAGHPATDPAIAELRKVSAEYGPVPALRGVDLSLRRGQITALMGRNGSGKSTLLSLVAGMQTPRSGQVAVADLDPARIPASTLVRTVGLVPQDPGMLLFCDRVVDECVAADADAGVPAGSTAALLSDLASDVDPAAHPRDLSEGQRLALALAVVLVADPAVLCLDEPTRGLDHAGKDALVSYLRRSAAGGTAVLLASHDVELVASVADRVVLLSHGTVVEDGPARHVVCQTPVFAPQVARVLGGQRWLTPEEVAAALGQSGAAT